MEQKEILDKLSDFHGHLGPYVVTGWRMGSIANRELGGNPFDKEALVKTGIGTPLSCLVDGIQFSSGCTLGKGNLRIDDSRKPEAVFSKEGKSLKVALKEEAWEEIKDLSEEDLERVSKEFFNRNEEELFRIEFSK